MRNKKGFTMIELIIVIAIIGILVAISVPAFQNLSQSARISATRGTLGAVRSALAIAYAQSATGGSNAVYPGAVNSSFFADNKDPLNSLQNGGGTGVVTTSAVPATNLTNAAGFWYISSGSSAGQAGAFAVTGTDSTINVGTF